MNGITMALAKGRLTGFMIPVLEKAGMDCRELKKETRRLILYDRKANIKFVLVKPIDVPTYVEYGSADMGIVGLDILLEQNKDCYEMLDLKFGKCKMVVAGLSDFDDNYSINKRVATKYPNIAQKYFQEKGENVEIIKINGSVELAPLVGLSEVIVDIVETGTTLKENGLSIINEIFSSSAKLIVNKASLKTKGEQIKAIIEKFRSVLNEKI